MDTNNEAPPLTCSWSALGPALSPSQDEQREQNPCCLHACKQDKEGCLCMHTRTRKDVHAHTQGSTNKQAPPLTCSWSARGPAARPWRPGGPPPSPGRTWRWSPWSGRAGPWRTRSAARAWRSCRPGAGWRTATGGRRTAAAWRPCRRRRFRPSAPGSRPAGGGWPCRRPSRRRATRDRRRGCWQGGQD